MYSSTKGGFGLPKGFEMTLEVILSFGRSMLFSNVEKFDASDESTVVFYYDHPSDGEMTTR